MKSQFTLQKYNKVYRTGSNAGKLYGIVKIHKLPELGTLDQLPLRMSNSFKYWYRIILSCEALSKNFSSFNQK